MHRLTEILDLARHRSPGRQFAVPESLDRAEVRPDIFGRLSEMRFSKFWNDEEGWGLLVSPEIGERFRFPPAVGHGQASRIIERLSVGTRRSADG